MNGSLSIPTRQTPNDILTAYTPDVEGDMAFLLQFLGGATRFYLNNDERLQLMMWLSEHTDDLGRVANPIHSEPEPRQLTEIQVAQLAWKAVTAAYPDASLHEVRAGQDAAIATARRHGWVAE